MTQDFFVSRKTYRDSKRSYPQYPFEVSISGVKYPIVIMAADIDDIYTVISEQSEYTANQIQSVIPVFSEREDCF